MTSTRSDDDIIELTYAESNGAATAEVPEEPIQAFDTIVVHDSNGKPAEVNHHHNDNKQHHENTHNDHHHHHHTTTTDITTSSTTITDNDRHPTNTTTTTVGSEKDSHHQCGEDLIAPAPSFQEGKTIPLSSSVSSQDVRSRSSSVTSNSSHSSSSSNTSSSVASLADHKRTLSNSSSHSFKQETGEITMEVIQQNIKLQKQLIEKSLKEREKIKREKAKEVTIQENMTYWHHTILPHIEKYGCIDKSMYKKWYRNGIPTSLRSKMWVMSLGNELQITKELYDILKDKRNVPSSMEKQVSSIDLITVDLSRTFPALQFFQYPDGPYYPAFKTILECYSKFRPDIGYVQGMSYIVATLLLYMDEFEAFVCFCNLLHRSKCNSNPLAMSLVGTPSGAAATSATTSSSSAASVVSSILFGPKKRTAAFTSNYQTLYSSNHFIPFFTMNTEYIDKHIKFVQILLREHNMPLYKHMVEKFRIEFSVFIVDWYITLFSKSLPLDVVARIWDGYLVHGRLYMYSCTIGILIYYEQELLNSDYEGIMKFLTHLSSSTNQFENLDIERLFSIINVDCRISDRRINKYLRMMEK